MRISDWSSDVCSSDLAGVALGAARGLQVPVGGLVQAPGSQRVLAGHGGGEGLRFVGRRRLRQPRNGRQAGGKQQGRQEKTQRNGHLEQPGRKMSDSSPMSLSQAPERRSACFAPPRRQPAIHEPVRTPTRTEEHTSELQSLKRISYAVFCLKKTTHNTVCILIARYTNQHKSL